MRNPSSFIAVDCATNNAGIAIMVDGKLKSHGKLFFEGDSRQEKAAIAAKVVRGFLKDHEVDAMVIESSYMGVNPVVAINLAMSQGAVIAAAALSGVKHVATVMPIHWQTAIGNPRLTREDKDAIVEVYPGKSASWYKAAGGKIRKARTMQIVNDRFGTDIDDNDVADAVGIAMYAYDNPERIEW